MTQGLSSKDREILRSLAARVREISELPEMAARARRWYALNSLKPERPMVQCSPEGAWGELLPPSLCQIEDPRLRDWEYNLRARVYRWEHIQDDMAFEAIFPVGWEVDWGNFGVSIPRRQGDNRGSYVWEPPIKDLDADFARLHMRRQAVDRPRTMEAYELARSVFDGLLEVRIVGWLPWTMGLTWSAIDLIGLERLMTAMIDEPDRLHRLMAFLRDDMMQLITWAEKEGVLSINNASGFVGSGGSAYTHELPQGDWKPGQPVRLKDLWGFGESQETVGVSPAMFGEFIFPYQLPLLAKFGLNCYGCCEAVHQRWSYIKRIPNLRRVSVSPWADQAMMAEAMGSTCVFSRKPNPAMICASFNEDHIRADIRNTLSIAGKLPLELVMKDTHTVQNQPHRITRWVRIAFEEIDRYCS
ncbi:MAG: hypothetical protein NTV86_05915 [Planctomycetota bacterium]|nr:hypothetical protein [Planctomycetota bacterium]